ncbi:MAG TPA: glycoside hydrolase family 2 TIM barrel-domain containing protein [Flavitalea sp.]|nr:glycoside hydrolase family 2 TIM barrel-domain containing protein [Flavitalea sp.]
MRFSINFFVLLLITCHCIGQTPAFSGNPVSFDKGWKFHKGGAQGAEDINFNDSIWRKVDLPHDWSIEDLPGTQSPFDANAISQVSGGFTTGGTGWYRKSFTVPHLEPDERITILFDGIYMYSDIYLNGKPVGMDPYGYTSFYFDITDKIIKDGENVIAVQVKNEGQNSRWYSGSGIYRHVWLLINEPVRFKQWSTFITTTSVRNHAADISIKTQVENKTERPIATKITVSLIAPSGETTGTTESACAVAADSTGFVSLQATIQSPSLWSPESPGLYKAITKVYSAGKLLDSLVTPFGIRTLSFDTSGFRLNGKFIKLKGGCVHHDNGPLGSRAYDRAEERKVELLRASGFNAIRCAHNPPSPAFLETCDRLGMLVIDEAFDMWRRPNNPHDYHLFFDKWWKSDIESLIYRDWNHPSVIIWSIGNEISGMNTPEIVNVAKELSSYVHLLDSTRPVAAAVNGLGSDKDNFIAALDVAGYNYAAGGDHGKKDIYAEDHVRKPGRIMFGSESYAYEAFQSWMQVVDKPWVLGDFVWTAFDYIGEASIGWRGYYQKSNFYPWNLAFCGDIDICGWKRPQSYYRDALWKPDQLAIFVKPPTPSFPLNEKKESWSKWDWYDAVSDWNWREYENKPIEVNIYSSCERVELFLNGTLIGSKKTGVGTKYIAKFNVPYAPGKLSVVGYKGKKKILTRELITAGEPAQLKLTVDRKNIKANGQDLAYVAIGLVDQNGNILPKADDMINFEIDGPGTIEGVGNANPMSTESYQQHHRKLWRGKCLVIIKSTEEAGDIKLTATMNGIHSQSVNISSNR